MPFIMSSQFLENFKGLQKEYERRTGVNLSNDPSPYSISCFFGSHNTLARKKQCNFLTSVYKELHPFLKGDTQTTVEQWQAYVVSHRILLTACVYVKSQIINSYTIKSPNSVMLTLLDEVLGVSPNNQLDDKAKNVCMVSTKQWLYSGNQLEQSSSAPDPFKYLSKNERADFARFLEQELAILNTMEQQSEFPLAKTMQPLLGAPCAIAGTQLGYMIGSFLVEKNNPATSLMLSMLLKYSTSLHPATFIGMAVITPTITHRVLSSVYGFSLSWALGKGFELVGQSVGFGIGMSLDLSLIVLKGTTNTLQAIIYHEEKKIPLSGLRLSDGHYIDCGVDRALDSIVFPITRVSSHSQSHTNEEQYDEALLEETLGIQ